MEKNQSGTEDKQSTGFSEDYVKQLREEAASWRTKFRELESGSKNQKIEMELIKNNIKAKPSWVEVKEGQSIEDAVKEFSQEFSHLVQIQESNDKKVVEKTIQTRKSTSGFTPPITKLPNQEVKDLNQILSDRSLDEVKDDPNSRKQVTEWYQSALRS